MSSDDLLKDRDYTIIIARSRVSRERNHPWFTEWVDAQASLIDLAKKCQEFDPDGLTIYEVSSFLIKYEHTTVNQLAEILQANNRLDPASETEINVGEALGDALNHYLQKKEKGEVKAKGEIIIVILDQHGIDGIGDIQTQIIKSTQLMEKQEELGITFIQIGDDQITRNFMMGLDNDLIQVGAKFDIVDTKYWHEVKRQSVAQFLIDAICD